MSNVSGGKELVQSEPKWIKQYLFGNEHTIVTLYTMPCKTGSENKRKPYIKVIARTKVV